MLQLNFQPFPIIRTNRLVLRAITLLDKQEIFLLRSDKTVLQYLDKAPASSVEEAEAFIELIQKDQQNNDGILWGIALRESPVIVGSISFWRLQKEHYRAEIGYALLPHLHGKGIMDEALKAVLKYGFESMQLHSVEANVNPGNTGSMKLLEKNGFVKEAYFKENYFFDGKFIDSVIYSILSNT